MISGGGALLNISNSKRSTCVPTETVALVPGASEALLADRVFGILDE
jgi:hypothetical protein